MIPRSQGRINSTPQLRQSPAFSGLSNLGQAIGGVVDARNELATKEAKVKVDDILTVELSEQVTKLKNDVANGAMGAEDANKLLSGWSEKRFKEIENDLPQHARQDLKNHWTSNVNRNGTGFLPLQLRADEQKATVIADEFSRIATRMPRAEGRSYLENQLNSLNRPESEKLARLQSYDVTLDKLEIGSRMNSGLESNNIGELQSLLTDIRENKYGHLDGATNQNEEKKVLSAINALSTRVEAEANKREQNASSVANKFIDNVLTGRKLDDSYRNSVKEALSGTSRENEFTFFDKHSAKLQEFYNLPTPEQERLITQQEVNMKNTPSVDPTTEQKVLDSFKKMHKEKIEKIKSNPNQAAREVGLSVQTITSADIRNNPVALAEKVIDNATSQRALKDKNLTLLPISQEDLPEVREAWEKSTVKEKLAVIGNLIESTKSVPGGAAIWGATLGQLDGKMSKVYLAAGKAYINKYGTDKGRDLATSIINGTHLLKSETFVIPNDLRSAFNERAGNTADDVSYEVFKAVYADTLKAQNDLHKKPEEIAKSKIADIAFTAATGGVYQQNGKFYNYMGGSISNWKVSKPYGMSDERFEDILEEQYPKVARYYGTSVAELKSLKLERVAERGKGGVIRYALTNERGNQLYHLNMPQGVTK